jgi:hypothetical protein
MMRGVALLVAIATAAFAQDESGKKNSDDSFEIEPPLLIPNRSDEPLPPVSVAATPAQDVDVAKMEKQLERAKRNVAGVERLCKIGALAKVDVEQRVLRMVRLESDLANVRLTLAKEAMLQKEKELAAGEISKEDLAETESTLARAIESAHAAATQRERAELEAAEANVQRQEKLLALGSGHKSDVARAEQKLAELRAAKN